ncbi:MAG TPA: hypothetical protein V6C57_11325 [Coleofasciculaceae cyanobacterium]
MMRSLSADQILQIWEIGQSQHPLDRALTLLAFACPGRLPAELAALSLGQRDAYLLTLRELTFGSRLNGFAECPQCAEPLEMSLNVSDIRLIDPDQPQPMAYQLTVAGIELQFRLPNSLDLAAVLQPGRVPLDRDVTRVNDRLVERCLLQASQAGQAIAYSDLPPVAIAGLAAEMSVVDPQAEIWLNLICPACNHSWQALFDIVSFFWTELNAQVKRLTQEVCTLARFYGWREADILAMTPMRRQLYLDLVSP